MSKVCIQIKTEINGSVTKIQEKCDFLITGMCSQINTKESELRIHAMGASSMPELVKTLKNLVLGISKNNPSKGFEQLADEMFILNELNEAIVERINEVDPNGTCRQAIKKLKNKEANDNE